MNVIPTPAKWWRIRGSESQKELIPRDAQVETELKEFAFNGLVETKPRKVALVFDNTWDGLYFAIASEPTRYTVQRKNAESSHEFCLSSSPNIGTIFQRRVNLQTRRGKKAIANENYQFPNNYGDVELTWLCRSGENRNTSLTSPVQNDRFIGR